MRILGRGFFYHRLPQIIKTPDSHRLFNHKYIALLNFVDAGRKEITFLNLIEILSFLRPYVQNC